MTNEKQVLEILRGGMGKLIDEELLLECLRDMVKDEIKGYLNKKLDENPEIREELREAMTVYLEAKLKEIYAVMKIAKCGAKLGAVIIPPEMKRKVSQEVAALLEKELSDLVEKTL